MYFQTIHLSNFFWADSDETDGEGKYVSPCHDMSGQMVTNKVQALKNIAKLKLDRPKGAVNDLALET